MPKQEKSFSKIQRHHYSKMYETFMIRNFFIDLVYEIVWLAFLVYRGQPWHAYFANDWHQFRPQTWWFIRKSNNEIWPKLLFITVTRYSYNKILTFLRFMQPWWYFQKIMQKFVTRRSTVELTKLFEIYLLDYQLFQRQQLSYMLGYRYETKTIWGLLHLAWFKNWIIYHTTSRCAQELRFNAALVFSPTKIYTWLENFRLDNWTLSRKTKIFFFGVKQIKIYCLENTRNCPVIF